MRGIKVKRYLVTRLNAVPQLKKSNPDGYLIDSNRTSNCPPEPGQSCDEPQWPGLMMLNRPITAPVISHVHGEWRRPLGRHSSSMASLSVDKCHVASAIPANSRHWGFVDPGSNQKLSVVSAGINRLWIRCSCRTLQWHYTLDWIQIQLYVVRFFETSHLVICRLWRQLFKLYSCDFPRHTSRSTAIHDFALCI